MQLGDFDYPLPDDRIAQVPVDPRDAARLMIDAGAGIPPEDSTVSRLA
ncbi:MAG: S-adenosylmethionine:tRNA ribosyltransferase-isomerase, partial [Candidatus Microthrix parvicella]